MSQKNPALQYLLFLKEKWYGQIKGCGCTIANKQHVYKPRKKLTHPLSALNLYSSLASSTPWKAMMLSHVKCLGHLYRLILMNSYISSFVKVEPSYAEFVTHEYGGNIVYTELSKAHYGT